MISEELTLTSFAVLGGLALFIFGMKMMAEGLRSAVGDRLRAVLTRSTRTSLRGYGLGAVLGAIVHSSAATVMLVGFVNAGIMRLPQTVATIFGANVGTTLSMQAVSFDIGAYCFAAIAIGALTNMAAPSRAARDVGRAILGFGLLFLGMETMSDAVIPHRDALAPLLQRFSGDGIGGLLLVVLTSAALTAIWQSSGATVAICFSLIQAGAIVELSQALPIVLGAHIGTCATALLGSIGTHIEARRVAVTHLVFNVINVAAAILLREHLLAIIEPSADDMVRQTANLHTFVMLASGVVLLPVARFLPAAVRFITPSASTAPEPSHLDEDLIPYPERALQASIAELQRVARLCTRSFQLNAELLLFRGERGHLREIRCNEVVINEIKLSMRAYLHRLTERYLSRRQTVLLQHLNRCMTQIERIGDHIESASDIAVKRGRERGALVDRGSLEGLVSLYRAANHVLELVAASLDPHVDSYQSRAEAILKARDDYRELSMTTRADFAASIEEKRITPIAAFYYAEYLTIFDSIVRHARMIALAQKHEDFWIKRKKLDRRAKDPLPTPDYDASDPEDGLDQLQEEPYP